MEDAEDVSQDVFIEVFQSIRSFRGNAKLSTWIYRIAGGTMPDKQLHESERMSEVAAALNSLPENQRVAFTLSKIDGFSNAEIAEIMNTTKVAVESLVSRAKMKVSRELETILKKND
jgi:RNA polymerase sigma-70 factor (ECF subfamily)